MPTIDQNKIPFLRPLLCMLFVCSGCVSGNSAPDISNSFGAVSGSAPLSSVAYTRILGKLLDVNGHPLKRAKVTVATSRDNTTVYTDDVGNFDVPVVFGENEAIELTFHVESRDYKHILRNQKISLEPISLQLKIAKDGNLVALEAKW